MRLALLALGWMLLASCTRGARAMLKGLAERLRMPCIPRCCARDCVPESTDLNVWDSGDDSTGAGFRVADEREAWRTHVAASSEHSARGVVWRFTVPQAAGELELKLFGLRQRRGHSLHDCAGDARCRACRRAR